MGSTDRLYEIRLKNTAAVIVIIITVTKIKVITLYIDFFKMCVVIA